MNSPEASPLPRGELLHRRSRRWAFAALVFALSGLVFVKPLWLQLITLGSGAFMLALGLWGLVLCIGLLLCPAIALYLRVEAIFTPRLRARRLGDALALACAVPLSFLPGLAAALRPLLALPTLSPARAGWLAAGLLLTVLVARYWWARWHSKAGA